MRRVNKSCLLAALAFAGCAHEPAPLPAPPAAPAAFSQSGTAADARWAEAFGDPARAGDLFRTTRAGGDNFLAVKVSYWLPVRFGGGR